MVQTLLRLSIILLSISSSRASWIDPDTPKQYHTTDALVEEDKREYALVCTFYSPTFLVIFLSLTSHTRNRGVLSRS
jgi:hypothetical protein